MRAVVDVKNPWGIYKNGDRSFFSSNGLDWEYCKELYIGHSGITSYIYFATKDCYENGEAICNYINTLEKILGFPITKLEFYHNDVDKFSVIKCKVSELWKYNEMIFSLFLESFRGVARKRRPLKLINAIRKHGLKNFLVTKKEWSENLDKIKRNGVYVPDNFYCSNLNSKLTQDGQAKGKIAQGWIKGEYHSSSKAKD